MNLKDKVAAIERDVERILQITNSRPRCRCNLKGMKYEIHRRYFDENQPLMAIYRWAKQQDPPYDKTFVAFYYHMTKHGARQWAWEKAHLGVVLGEARDEASK